MYVAQSEKKLKFYSKAFDLSHGFTNPISFYSFLVFCFLSLWIESVSFAQENSSQKQETVLFHYIPPHGISQYGASINSMVNLDPGRACMTEVDTSSPCILGNGGGLGIRLGYRFSQKWYLGGVYSFANINSGNLYRLGIFQHLLAEVRYYSEVPASLFPYISFGLGPSTYGNEWGIETGGGQISLGLGLEWNLSSKTAVGIQFSYQPILLLEWHDSVGFLRNTGVAQFISFEFNLESRGAP